jgi:hypothetical protein
LTPWHCGQARGQGKGFPLQADEPKAITLSAQSLTTIVCILSHRIIAGAA